VTSVAVASPPELTDEQLAALTTEQRADLARRLAVMAAGGRPRRWLTGAAVTGAVTLAAWIFALADRLPHRYLADNWDTAWVGYDVALLAGLALTAWAAWRASRLLAPAAFTTAVLLVCDAWFDVMTAATTADRTAGMLTALAAELPLAAVLVWVARVR
jgi:hypothetical protein